MLITVFSISCKNNSTMSEFAYDYGTFDIDATNGFSQFANKVFLSDEAVVTGSDTFLWVQTTEIGIKYTVGPKTIQPNFSSGFSEIPLGQTAGTAPTGKGPYSIKGNPLQSGSDDQEGTVTFDIGGKLTIEFTKGNSYINYGPIACRYVIY